MDLTCLGDDDEEIAPSKHRKHVAPKAQTPKTVQPTAGDGTAALHSADLLARLARQKFRQNIERWRHVLLMDPAKPSLGSWLVSKGKMLGNSSGSSSSTSVAVRHRQEWGVGCMLCAIAKKSGPYAMFAVRTPSALTMQHLIKHAGTSPHKAAAELVLHGTSSDARSSPPAEHFEEVLKDRVTGIGYAHGHEGVGAQLKVKRMTWCLSEALLDEDRAALRNAKSITIHQDGSGPRFVVRFTACTADLEMRQGTMGIAKDYGTRAQHIKEATEKVLRTFCSPKQTPPGRQDMTSELDTKLLAHVQQHVHTFDADGAADEQRAGRCMAQSTFPNMDTRMRDKAHASRRPRLSLSLSFTAVCLSQSVKHGHSIAYTLHGMS